MGNKKKHDVAYWDNNLYVWILTRFTKYDVSSHAGHVTFFLLLSFFPTIMLILKLASQLPGVDPNAVINTVESLAPGNLKDILASSIQDILTPSGGIYIFTIITLLWAGSKGFDGLAMALDSIYSSKNRRGYLIRRAFSVLYLIGFVLMFLVSIGLIVFGGFLLDYINEHFNIPFDGFMMRILLRYGLIILIFIVFFVLLLRFGPYTPGETKEEQKARREANKNKPFRERTKAPKQRTWKKEVPGALLTTTLWLIFTKLFSIYVEYRLAHPSYYGSLASVFLTLLWLYFCMIFIFIGALYNNFAYRHGESSTRHLIKDLPGFFRYIGLMVTRRI